MNIKSILVSMLALFALGGTSFADDQYGPITIKKVNGKKIAYIDDDANVPLPEIKSVRVDGVSFNRVFKGETANGTMTTTEGGVASTLMLPFDISVSDLQNSMNKNQILFTQMMITMMIIIVL